MTADRNFSTHAQVRRLTVCAMLTAIIWLLTVSPIGFTLPFFGISMTFNHIPMIIGTLMEGLGVGCVLAGHIRARHRLRHTRRQQHGRGDGAGGGRHAVRAL